MYSYEHVKSIVETSIDDLVDEALVVAEVQVRLGAVVGDEDLAVLVRRHRAGIDIEIGVELAQPDLVAARLQRRAKRRRCKPLAQ